MEPDCRWSLLAPYHVKAPKLSPRTPQRLEMPIPRRPAPRLCVRGRVRGRGVFNWSTPVGAQPHDGGGQSRACPFLKPPSTVPIKWLPEAWSSQELTEGWDAGGVGVREASPSGPRPLTPTLGQGLGAGRLWLCAHHVSSLNSVWEHGVLWRPLSAWGAPSPSRPRAGQATRVLPMAGLPLPGVPAPLTWATQEPRGHAERPWL